MSLNVLFEGISLAEGATVVPGELGLFLPLAAPMPVGTRLVLERPGRGRQRVRVNKVREGADPGVYIAAEGAIVFPLVEEHERAPGAAIAAPNPVASEVTAPSSSRVKEPAAPPAAAEFAAPVASEPESFAGEPGDLVAEPTIITPSPFDERAAAGPATAEAAATAGADANPGAAADTHAGAAADTHAGAAADTDDDEPPTSTANGTEKPEAGDRGGRGRRRNKRGGGRR